MKYLGVFFRFLLLLAICAPLGANGTSPSPDSLFNRANQQFAQGYYQEAAFLYQQAADSGYVAAELFFNLGNAYFKQNQIAPAILNFERALLLAPSNDDFHFNLDMANSFIVDKIEPLPEVFIVTWTRSITSLFNSAQWARVSIILFAVALVLFILFWFSKGRSFKRLYFTFALFALVLTVSSMLFASSAKRKLICREHAIVMAPVVAVKSSPGETGKDIFIVHAGTKVKITNRLGEWKEVKIANGNKGWLPKDVVEGI